LPGKYHAAAVVLSIQSAVPSNLFYFMLF